MRLHPVLSTPGIARLATHLKRTAPLIGMSKTTVRQPHQPEAFDDGSA
ncbi:hypothetical protein PJK45_07340 [Mycobacterium kansasii]|nr:hypothetical protein [Mycobacterium kansasii]AGZ54420.1 hypothetical protein MKAN_22900 [Mycobacterium kansasii ATCC 12478]KEP43275.1 hypothetical protein MKSMC1_16620 [Mycobacterium kansasii]UGU24140.1 hypothetical protein LT351_22100 [Mycobacterium kansasii]VAZ59454.1 hypothetical protein LAUMK22_01253 [Mycobacterium kansasii]VAZ65768.1 hypothetical protein LAUMK40_01898 [Mycobacterium kansasii]